jgi:DNA-binding MarR family transcriptional regulator
MTFSCRVKLKTPHNPVQPTSGNGLQDELEFLFLEVNALATRLKVAARQLHFETRLPAGGRAILQGLARNGPQSVPQLARARATSRQNIQTLVNRFETEGWVEFAVNPAHKRSDLVQLTERGRELLAGALDREASYLAPLLSHSSEADVLAAAVLLKEIRAALGTQTFMPAVGVNRRKSRSRSRKPQPPSAVATLRTQTLTEPTTPEEESGLPLNLL